MGWLALYYLLEILKWLVIARAVSSWFVDPHSRHPAVETLRRVTDPVIRPVGAVLPPMGGIDLAPLVTFIAIILLQRVLVQLAHF